MKGALSLIVAAVVLAACGQSVNGHSMGMSATPAGHNSQDVMFAQMMIKHHRGAATMTKTEQEQGIDTEAKALAGSIVSSQSAEIATMKDLLRNL